VPEQQFWNSTGLVESVRFMMFMPLTEAFPDPPPAPCPMVVGFEAPQLKDWISIHPLACLLSDSPFRSSSFKNASNAIVPFPSRDS
jgi:hypothetical protein